MRTTKKNLEQQIAYMKQFQACEFLTVSLKHAASLRNVQGFVPVHQYGAGSIPALREIGYLGHRRFILGKLSAWKGTS